MMQSGFIGFMGMVFNNFLHFPDLWVQFSVRIHLLVTFFTISGFIGMIFRNFSGFMGGTCTILIAQPRILEIKLPPGVEISAPWFKLRNRHLAEKVCSCLDYANISTD